MATRVMSSRLIGRLAELAELEAALADASTGRPSLAFIAGESGVGKTRLLQELERRALASGTRVIVGECVALGEDELPYAPIVAALRSLTRDGDPVLDELGPAARAGLASLLPELSPAESAAVDSEEQRPGVAQARVFEGLLTLLDRLGRESPVLLTIEDLHWADSSTRAFLAFLARSLRAERVLVAASYRPDELHRRHPLRPLLAELERGPRARRVELQPLSRDELAEQLADILGALPEADLVARLHARSEGNPLFTEELLAAGLDGRGDLPPTLRDALMVRVERLPGAAQELLRLLAIGRRLDHALMAEASHLDPVELREALREAVAGHIIVAENDVYAFRHALLREVVHDDLLPGEHVELHLALARALERRVEAGAGGAQIAAGIAHHYLAAGDQPAAFTAAVRAAKAAYNIHAYGESATLLERALELWPRVAEAEGLINADHPALLARAAWSHEMDGHKVRSAALYEAAVAEVDEAADPHRASELLERLANARWSLGAAEPSLATLEHGLELLPDNDTSRERALLLGLRAKFLGLRGKLRNATEAAREALVVAKAAGDPAARSRALNVLGSALTHLGQVDEGTDYLREALRLSAAEGRWGEMVNAYNNLSDALHAAGRSEEARAVALEGLERATERGRPTAWLELQATEVALDTGDWAFAAEHIPHVHAYEGNTHLNAALRRAELALGRGEHGVARPLIEQAEESTRGLQEPQFIGVLGALHAELERREGHLREARAAIRGALDRIETCTDDVARLARVAAVGTAVEADAAQRARDVGDADATAAALLEADFHVARSEAAADEGGPVERAWLASARAEHARAAQERDPGLYETAAAAWDAIGRPYPAAVMRWREAETYVEAGEREDARAALFAARETTIALRANWLRGEIEGLAARARLAFDDDGAPAPPAHADTEDPFGLTPRERQVLALVAEGRTNREIGETLYMAEKTASVHVSRILAKLGVRGRTEAAAVAHRLGLDAAPAGQT
jgi:DNA-binding NarL/FixJ family response regulator/tetratricopeptide (TPR) repeat protein